MTEQITVQKPTLAELHAQKFEIKSKIQSLEEGKKENIWNGSEIHLLEEKLKNVEMLILLHPENEEINHQSKNLL
jgi:hypothetical protein